MREKPSYTVKVGYKQEYSIMNVMQATGGSFAEFSACQKNLDSPVRSTPGGSLHKESAENLELREKSRIY